MKRDNKGRFSKGNGIIVLLILLAGIAALAHFTGKTSYKAENATTTVFMNTSADITVDKAIQRIKEEQAALEEKTKRKIQEQKESNARYDAEIAQLEAEEEALRGKLLNF